MSTFTDLEKDAASVDGFVNENGLIETRRNGPKPSYQYLVDGWNSEFDTLISDFDTQVDNAIELINEDVVTVDTTKNSALDYIDDATAEVTVKVNNFNDVADTAISDFEGESQAAILEMNKSRGFRVVGTFADGFTYELPNDVAIDGSGNYWAYADINALPVTVPAGTTPTEGEYSQRTWNEASAVVTAAGINAQQFIDNFELKIFQSPTDNLTKVSTFAGGVGVVYEVRKTSDNSLATIYSDKDGVTEITQNGTVNVSGANAEAVFYIEKGVYYVTVDGVSEYFTLADSSSFKSVDEMVSFASLDNGSVVSTQGYYEPGDYGGANYLIKELQDVRDQFDDQTYTPDGYVNHAITGTTMVAMYIPDNHEWNINCVGAKSVPKGDSQAGNIFDSYPAVQSLFDYLHYIQEPQGRKSMFPLQNFSAAHVKAPIGSYYFSDELECNVFSVKIEGASIAGNAEGSTTRGTVFNYMGVDGTEDIPKYVLKIQVSDPQNNPIGTEFNQARGTSYHIENIAFRGTSTHGNQAWPLGVTYVSGIYQSTVHLATLEHCSFTDLYDGFVDAGHGLFNKIRSCWFYDIDRDAISSPQTQGDFTTTMWIENTEVGYFGRYGIFIDGSGGSGNSMIVLDSDVEGQKPNGIVKNPENFYMGFTSSVIIINPGMCSRLEGLRMEDNRSFADLHIAGGELNVRDCVFSNNNSGAYDKANVLFTRTGLKNAAYSTYRSTYGHADLTADRNTTDSNSLSGDTIRWVEITGGVAYAARIISNGRMADIFGNTTPNIINTECSLMELPAAITNGDTSGTDNRWDDRQIQTSYTNLVTNRVKYGISPIEGDELTNIRPYSIMGNNTANGIFTSGALNNLEAEKRLSVWWTTGRNTDAPKVNYNGWFQNNLYVRQPLTQASSNLVNQPMYFANVSDGASNNKYYEIGVLTPNITRYQFNSPPAGGTGISNRSDWVRGDVLYKQYPSAGGKIGWICTTGGGAGTAVFKEFGAIDA